jgi:hypothetical protein
VLLVELSQPCSTHFQLSTSYCMLLNAPHTPFHSSLIFLLLSIHSPPFLNPHHLPFASVTTMDFQPQNLVVHRSTLLLLASLRRIDHHVRFDEGFNSSPYLSNSIRRFRRYGDFQF